MKVKNSIEFRQLILDIGIINQEAFDSVGIVMAARCTAEMCWLKKVPEDERTVELRRQLNHLGDHGVFDYERGNK